MNKYDISEIYYLKDKKSFEKDMIGVISEFSVDVKDESYLVVYGKHINGRFISLVNWGICCEAGEGVGYNVEKLYEKLKRIKSEEHSIECASAIANAINEINELLKGLYEENGEFDKELLENYLNSSKRINAIRGDVNYDEHHAYCELWLQLLKKKLKRGNI